MTMVSPDDGRSSISRTARYKKVTKPLLERKRRARINRSLEELKDLMVGAFEVEGDNISKLEKADILELTVRHLTKLHSTNDPEADAKRFQAGFGQCAAEACQFILSMPEIDSKISENLVNHLRSQIAEVSVKMSNSPVQSQSQPNSPEASSSWSQEQYRCQNSAQKPSPTQEYRMQQSNVYRRPDAPSIPINQSLVCDTSMTVPTMAIHDLSKPLTGLLMTVDKNSKEPAQCVSKNGVHHNIEYEIKKKHNADVKHVIMQKIREQILGRQIREVDHNIPTSMHPQPVDHYHYRNIQANPYVQNQGVSMDLRKKSKGAAKHFSPRLNDVVKMKYPAPETHNIVKDDDRTPHIPEAINYSTVNRTAYEDTTPNINVRKRKADYRSMHPKKVFMNCSPEIEENGYQHKSNVVQNDNVRQQVHNYRNDAPPPIESTRNHAAAYHQYEYRRQYPMPPYNRPVDQDNVQEDSMWRPW